MADQFRVFPLPLKFANDAVTRMHRHHTRVQGHRFSLGLLDLASGKLVGAAIVGRPVARAVDQHLVAEVTRLVTDGTKNACSALYGAAARVAKEMGFNKIQTYILESETGLSLKATGWVFETEVAGRSWDAPSRRRVDKHPTEGKQRWAKKLNGGR